MGELRFKGRLGRVKGCLMGSGVMVLYVTIKLVLAVEVGLGPENSGLLADLLAKGVAEGSLSKNAAEGHLHSQHSDAAAPGLRTSLPCFRSFCISVTRLLRQMQPLVTILAP